MATITACFSPYGYVDGTKSIDFILKEQLRGKNYELYKNMEIDTDCFDKEDIFEELRENYEAFGVEEYFIADAWCDDDEAVQEIVGEIYSESYVDFLDSVEEIFEDDKLQYYDEEIIRECIKDHGISDFKKYLDEYQIYDDVQDFYNDMLEQHGIRDTIWNTGLVHCFMWLSEDTRYSFMNAQGYSCRRLNGGHCLTWRD